MKRFLFALALAASPLGAFAETPPRPAPLEDADFRPVRAQEAELGQLLFYDPILSGNREVACATCHHPGFGTGDGLSLSLGDGGLGLGPARVPDLANPPEARVPRNAQPLFNLGAHEYTTLFHDGRIAADPDAPHGLRTPLGGDMPVGFSSILSAQAMFPVLSADEMAGHLSENDVSKAVRMGRLTGPGGAWDIIARRVAVIPAYGDHFAQVYDHIAAPEDIAFTDIANAMAAFIEFEWRADGSAYDGWLRLERPLTLSALRGMEVFAEKGCDSCHAGRLFTDHSFHAMGQPQIGPGKAAVFEHHTRDEGRFRVTGDPADRFAFRTPTLRNVLMTGPWGHAGAYSDMRSFLAAHAAPRAALLDYDKTQAVLIGQEASDWLILESAAEVEAIAAAAPEDRPLAPEEIEALIAFFATLSDPVSIAGRLGVPPAVPSGLPVPSP